MTRTLTGFALQHDFPAKLLPGKSEAKGKQKGRCATKVVVNATAALLHKG